MTILTEFIPTQWATSEEKAKTAKALLVFIDKGFLESKFTNRLYKVLHTELFGHIAHFNKEGFYARWFSSTARQVEWVENALGAYRFQGEVMIHSSFWIKADPKFTWSDVERYLRQQIFASGVLDELRTKRAQEVESAERAELKRLSEKYGAA